MQRPRSRPARHAVVIALIGWCACASLALAAAVLLIAGPSGAQSDIFGGVSGAAFICSAIAFGSVGAVIVARLPGNPVGRVMLALGLVSAAGMFLIDYARYAQAHSGTAVAIGAWLASPLTEVIAPLFGLSMLYFPDGRLTGRRWRAAVGVCVAGIFCLVISGLLMPGPLDAPFGAYSNPVGFEAAAGLINALDLLGWLLAIAGIAAGAASMVIRLRSATAERREQLVFVLTSGAVLAVAVTVTMLTWLIWPDGDQRLRMAVIGVAFTLYAVSVGVAITRYRLYELGRVVNRTVVYLSVTLVLVAVWALVAIVFGAFVGGDSRLVTATATLAAAALFSPARRRLQRALDRRFDAAAFAAHDRVETLDREIRAGRAQPEDFEGLLRELMRDPGLELRFVLPASGTTTDALGVARPAAAGARETAIEVGGARIGTVLHREFGAREAALLASLTGAGANAVELIRLRLDLRRQLADAEASRARILTASDEERRRLERDLHDGAQQRLVSIGLAVRHIEHRLGAAPLTETTRELDAVVEQLSLAVEELRSLAQGLPPSQLDRGLRPALDELAERVPLPVSLDVGDQRYPADLEAAAYFVACEGITNAIKHSRAQSVTVSVRSAGSGLVIRVADDGIGGAQANGSGLRGLRDRTAALNGELRIESPAGAGTTLTAELMCAS